MLRPAASWCSRYPPIRRGSAQSDRWAGHVRRYTRATLTQARSKMPGSCVEEVRPWGFPMSALLPPRRSTTRGPPALAERRARARGSRRACFVPSLTIDRLFVGVERGCLGYLALARRPIGDPDAQSLDPESNATARRARASGRSPRTSRVRAPRARLRATGSAGELRHRRARAPPGSPGERGVHRVRPRAARARRACPR